LAQPVPLVITRDGAAFYPKHAAPKTVISTYRCDWVLPQPAVSFLMFQLLPSMRTVVLF